MLGVPTLTITTVTSRELNQNTARAKRAANLGPVFITKRGQPTHVLLSIQVYRRLSNQNRNLAEPLSMRGLADIDLEPARTSIRISAPDFS